ncbi:uncharacterized protein TRIADDRAFT_31423 [Trichoplax adhaerens]|uniref:Sec20 C-terminal domain-containing protein n=1 Tax=Trichoplax adhaerens TaxID=10228 RepID=B3S8Y5_TRIAD|nr:hypothetical protein TRIADDRAFT_31423 [Trichoplax adhaerens]EDV20784.1 hypothetical protein TRIADDRAFT_31423 [Trichoplax adhaerens]|eukprot:XP_002116725.1 hypothetical protein TRIADDRAFT_31423 [Trichoplax adhaerens]
MADITFSAVAKLQIQEIIRLEFEIQSIIQQIKDSQGPFEILNRLHSQVKDCMKILEEDVNKLKILAHEEDKDSQTQEILQVAGRHQQQLESSQKSLRRALLTAKTNIENTDRQVLIEGGSSQLRQRVQTKKEAVKLASEVTNELIHINQMMAEQVKQSEQNMQLLATSSMALTDTGEELKNQSGVITSSNKLLTKYGRRELTDTVVIFFGVLVFLATVLYILKKRMF